MCCDALGRITVLLVLAMPRPPGMACVDSGHNLKGAVHDGIHRLVDEGWGSKGSVFLGLMHLVLA